MSDSIECKSCKITVKCNICKIDEDAKVYDKQTGYLAFTFHNKKCKICGELFYVCSICESVNSEKRIQIIRKHSFTFCNTSSKNWRLKNLCSEYCQQVWDIVPKEEIVNER